FANPETRWQVYLMGFRAAFFPLGALWVVVSLQLRLKGARFSTASVLGFIFVTTSIALPHTIAAARATGNPAVVLPRTIGGALIPFLAICLLTAFTFEHSVRAYLEGDSFGSHLPRLRPA